MSTICWKCGSEVPDGAQACSKCGAAAAGSGSQAAQPFAAAVPQATPGQGYTSPPPPPPAAPFQPAAPPFQSSASPAQPGFAPVQQGYSPPPPPMGGQPVAAPMPAKSGGNTVLKVLLIIFGVIVLVVVMIVAAVGYIGYRAVHAVREAANGHSVTIPGANGGSISLNSAKTYSAAELGTDIYPGATAIRGGMKMDLPTGSMVTGIFTTSDSKDQVVTFYKDKLGSDVSSMDFGESAMLTLKRGDKEQVTVTISNKAGENDGKTKIAITHTTSKTH